MNKYLKAIFLSATLLIPVAIFLFLKMFGDNKFDIPLFYQEGVPHVFEGCSQVVGGQYKVELQEDIESPVAVFFLNNKSFDYIDYANIKQRVNDAVENVSHAGFTNDSALRQADLTYLDNEAFIKEMHCNFATDTVNQFILVDGERRIRGYYNTDREEVDRLIVELKILLENERDAK